VHENLKRKIETVLDVDLPEKKEQKNLEKSVIQ
jgi:hypothetical protein